MGEGALKRCITVVQNEKNLLYFVSVELWRAFDGSDFSNDPFVRVSRRIPLLTDEQAARASAEAAQIAAGRLAAGGQNDGGLWGGFCLE